MQLNKYFNKNTYINVIIGLLISLLLFIVIAALNINNEIIDEVNNDLVEVHFIDVGQAKASLIIGPDFTVLIDAGHYRRDDVVSYLKDLDIREIDLLVGTHPHADHIGQFDKILNTFHVSEVWMSGDVHTTRTFERAIDAILQSNANYYEPRTGDKFQFGSLLIEILNPVTLTGDFHEGSIALKAIYKDFSILYTGDIERSIEQKIVNLGQNLVSTILELGHHGSRTSSSTEFLVAVAPEIAIYSAGIDNMYGHPHQEILTRLEKMRIPVYGTDVYGTIIVKTDGFTYELFVENE